MTNNGDTCLKIIYVLDLLTITKLLYMHVLRDIKETKFYGMILSQDVWSKIFSFRLYQWFNWMLRLLILVQLMTTCKLSLKLFFMSFNKLDHQ
jgi:hypothetical protein